LKDIIQAGYERRLSRYAGLIHGISPPGLIAKLAIYSSFVDQHCRLGDKLWRIEPLLPHIMQSIEVDLHLTAAKLLENPRRSERSLFKFLEFCLANREHISWCEGSPPSGVLCAQQEKLEAHRQTIAMIMGRRDKFYAHLDKKYFDDGSAIFVDFPVSQQEVIALVNCVISIISEHQSKLDNSVSFHLAEFFHISVDNMVRNLRTGRETNFPGQVEGG